MEPNCSLAELIGWYYFLKLVFNFSWFISFDSVLKVNFLSQVIFAFFLFWGMVMYANDVKTNGKFPEIKN